MALTRGDKMIIIGAVALAATVVVGLAILKKPRLFSGGAAEQVAAIPPAPTAAAPVPTVQAPIGAVGQASAPIPAAPATAGPATGLPAAVAPAPTPPVPAPVAANPAPTANGVTPTPAKPAGGTPPTAKPAPLPTVAGDDTLEKMFAEITSDTPAKGKQAKTGDKAAPHAPAEPAPAPPLATTPAEPMAAPAPTETPPAMDTATPAAVEPVPAAPAPPAKGKEKSKDKAKPAATAAVPPATPAPKPAAKAEAKPAAKTEAKPVAKVETPPTAASGTVIRIVAEEKPGQYELLIQTSKAPGTFTKMFLTDPPRLVVDVAGAWNYTGPAASDTGDAFIRHIRVGRHPDMFRVVLDMSPEATAKLRGAPTLERVPEGVLLRIPK
ncbi:MAG: AMIN domain-containing protein [Solidesulfovibrio sp. DCME]|uniref:AMIN domain-containing protein n=1 Tax=Solidesulfovibrio sp. DCME TaxID=3447380 RepID=UPI003D100F59